MIDLTGISHNPVVEKIVDVLTNKTQNTDRSFFRIAVAYYFAKAASCMRAYIATKDRGELPVNCYALDVATSGFGKGYSTSIIENEILKGFQHRFTHELMPQVAEENISKLSAQKAMFKHTDEIDEYNKYKETYNRSGTYAFTFDSGTIPAVKQLREKLLLAQCGSINLQIDEIASNLTNNIELLVLFLELYDKGLVKQKLTKNTQENVRAEELIGSTPSNMLLFGTPIKLFDGAMTEKQFIGLLDTGYARRFLFGYGQPDKKSYLTSDAEQIYYDLVNPVNDDNINELSDMFYNLADPTMYKFKIEVPDEVGIKLIEYKIACEKLADTYPEHEEMKKAELAHRYSKALKVAGSYAFIEASPIITLEHLMQSILLVEESGQAFEKLLNREPNYVRLAKYISSINDSVTHTDIMDELPFYRTTVASRNDLMTLATAWGLRHHIIIKKNYVESIEFFKGETLKETNLDDMIFSYSNHVAFNYVKENGSVGFEDLPKLFKAPDYNWCNHVFSQGHRLEKSAIEGFNMIVLDIDHGVKLETVHKLFKDYEYITYTTKRHTEEENRFRLIFPTNYILKLSEEDYKDFMKLFSEWLPFEVDEQTFQRSRKWSCNPNAIIHVNQGKLIDALKFIPKTSNSEKYQKELQNIGNMDNLERWFANQITTGNRNNQLFKYAAMLQEEGLSLNQLESKVIQFNNKLSNPLSKDELDNTVIKSIARKYIN